MCVGEAIRKLVADGLIIRKPDRNHSRARARKRAIAKAKGRHCGPGKMRGTAEARNPSKQIWIRKIRVQRKLLREYRENGQVDKKMYYQLYLATKGNMFKHKRALVEHIHRAKADQERNKVVEEQLEARRLKQRSVRERREARAQEKRAQLIADQEAGDQ